MPKNRQYQTVILTASDGTIHKFTGPAAFMKNTELRIINIQFTEPRDMPEDCSWETIEEDK